MSKTEKDLTWRQRWRFHIVFPVDDGVSGRDVMQDLSGDVSLHHHSLWLVALREDSARGLEAQFVVLRHFARAGIGHDGVSAQPFPRRRSD